MKRKHFTQWLDADETGIVMESMYEEKRSYFLPKNIHVQVQPFH